MQSFGFRLWGLGFRIPGLGFGVEGSGFWGLGFGVREDTREKVVPGPALSAPKLQTLNPKP